MSRKQIEVMFQKIPVKKNRFKKEQKQDYRSVRKSARKAKSICKIECLQFNPKKVINDYFF